MPSKDFGRYIDAAGATVIDTAGPDVAYSSTVSEDLAFSLDEGGRAEVTCNDVDRNVLVIHSARAKLASGATGTRTWREVVFVDDQLGGGFVAAKQSYAMGFVSDADGITQSQVCAASVVNLQQGHKLKVRQILEAANGTGNFEEVGQSSLQLLALPRSFPVCILSRSTQFVLAVSTWNTIAFDEKLKVDGWAFIVNTTTGTITVRRTGVLNITANVCVREDAASGSCQGAIVQTRMLLSSVGITNSQRSGHCPAVAVAQSYCSLNSLKRVAVVAGDVIEIQARVETRVGVSETFRTQQSRCAVSLFMEYGVSADDIHMESIVDQACNATLDVEWDDENSKSTPPFVHSLTESQHQFSVQADHKYLLTCALSHFRGTPTTVGLAFETVWRVAGVSSYAGAGGVFNRGKIGSTNQDMSSLQMATLLFPAANTVVSVQQAKAGTGSDSTVKVIGSTTSTIAAADLVGIDLQDWPADRADGEALGTLGEAGHGRLDATVGQLATAAMGTLGEAGGTATATTGAGGQARGVSEAGSTATAGQPHGGEVHALGEAGATGAFTLALGGSSAIGSSEALGTGSATLAAGGVAFVIGEGSASHAAAGLLQRMTIRSVTEAVDDFRVYYPATVEGNAVDDSTAVAPLSMALGVTAAAIAVGEALATATASLRGGALASGLSEADASARGGFSVQGQAVGISDATGSAGGRTLVYAVTVAVSDAGGAAGALLVIGGTGQAIGEAVNAASTAALLQGVQAVAIGGGVALGTATGGLITPIEARAVSEALGGGIAGVTVGLVSTGIGEVLTAVAAPGLALGSTALGTAEGIASLAQAALRLDAAAVALGEGLVGQLLVGSVSATEVVTFEARINRSETIDLEVARSVSIDAEIEATSETGLER
jgi:hypothetical protein